jgi:hypothetical protein
MKYGLTCHLSPYYEFTKILFLVSVASRYPAVYDPALGQQAGCVVYGMVTIATVVL